MQHHSFLEMLVMQHHITIPQGVLSIDQPKPPQFLECAQKPLLKSDIMRSKSSILALLIS